MDECKVVVCTEPAVWEGTLSSLVDVSPRVVEVRYCDEHAQMQRSILPDSLALELRRIVPEPEDPVRSAAGALAEAITGCMWSSTVERLEEALRPILAKAWGEGAEAMHDTLTESLGHNPGGGPTNPYEEA